MRQYIDIIAEVSRNKEKRRAAVRSQPTLSEPERPIIGGVSFFVCKKELSKTLNNYLPLKDQLKDKITVFMTVKKDSPDAMFTKTDAPFSRTANIWPKNVFHAHLTGNISLVYGKEGMTIKLFGVYTHDDLGIGAGKGGRQPKQQAHAAAYRVATWTPFNKPEFDAFEQ